jgi:hypothetical protein
MCIIAIKPREVAYPSYKRVKNMCENNSDGFAIVWHVNGEPVRNYRTLNEKKFLKKYNEITSTYKAKDVSLFIHARIKTHGTQKLENCHGWIEDKIGLAFAHNGILSIKNRDDMTDSETFFRDIFAPVFEIGGWDAGERAIKACIGTSKFCFMDMYGNLIHYGNYIKGDDGILYSNDSYLERTWTKYEVGGYYGTGYRSCWDKYDKYFNKNKDDKKTSTTVKSNTNTWQDDYDDWYNSEEYWKDRAQSPF